MAGKDLTFKLVMDADVKSFVTNLKQSEAQAKAIFDLIRQESERMRQSSLNAAGGIDQLDRSLQSTTNTTTRFDQQVRTTNTDLNRTETSASAAATQAHALESAFSKLLVTLASVGIGVSAREMLDAADAYKTFAAQIKVAIGEHGNLVQAMQDVIDISLRTHTSLEATSQLYAKIVTATKDFGKEQEGVFSRAINMGEKYKLTQQDTLSLVETINKAVQVSGGNAASAEAGLFQLNQSLSSGVLRGEEFNSVMEQTPRLARAMADGLGVTIGQLRNMANNSQLTSDVVTKAMLSQASVISAEFEKFPTTIGQSIQDLKTSWTIFLGELDKTHGVTASVSSAIELLAKNLDTVVATFKTVIEVIGAYKATQLVAYLNNKSAAFTNTANSIRYSTTQLASNTAAELENARASQTSTQANNAQAQTARQLAQANQALALTAVEEARAESGKALAQLESLQTTRTLVQAEMQLEQTRLAAQINATGRAQSITRMAELGRVQAQVTKEITAAEQQLNTVRAAGTAAAQRLAAANNAVLASGLTVGQKLSVLNNALMAGISKLGAYAAAIFGLVMVFDLLKKAGEAAGEGIAKVVLHAQGLKTVAENEAIIAKQDEDLKKKATEAAEAKRKQAAAAETAKNAALGLTAASKNVVDAFDKEIKAGNAVADAMKKVTDSFNFTNLDGINNAITALSALQTKGIATADDIRKALSGALQGQDLLVFQTNASAVANQIKNEMGAAYADLTKKKQAYDDFVKNSNNLSYADFQKQVQPYKDNVDQAQAKVTTLQTQYNNAVQSTALVHGAVLDEAIRRTGMSYEELSGKSTEAFISAKNDVDITVASLDELKARGVDTGKAVGLNINNAIKEATNQEELDGLKTKVESLRGVLGDKIADGLLQQIDEQMIAIKTKSDEAIPGINSVTEAFARFGLVTKEQADVASNSLISSFKVMQSSGKATAEQLKQALIQMADQIYSSGNQAKITWYENQIAVNGLKDSIDSMGKHSVSAIDNISESAKNADNGFRMLGESAQENADKAKNAWDGVADSIDKVNEKSGGAISVWYSQDVIKAKLKEINPQMDDKEVEQLSKKIYDQTKGTSYAGAADASQGYLQSKGYSAGQIAVIQSTPNISNIEAVNEQLDIYAKKFAAQTKATELAAKAADQAKLAPQQPTSEKTVRYEIVNGQRKAVLYGDSAAGTDLEGVMSQLETLKKAGA